MNTELINKIIAHLEEHPEDMNMGSWFHNYNHSLSLYDFFEHLKNNIPIPCGTTACIAGWSILLSPEDHRDIGYNFCEKQICIQDLAAGLLDITTTEAHHLFYKDEWSYYYRALAEKQGDAVAALRILRRGLKKGNFRFLYGE